MLKPGDIARRGVLKSRSMIVDQGLVRHYRGSRMTAGDNPISDISAAEEALARLSPHRTHESNWFKALLCALGLHRWYRPTMTIWSHKKGYASAAGVLRSGCQVSECDCDFATIELSPSWPDGRNKRGQSVGLSPSCRQRPTRGTRAIHSCVYETCLDSNEKSFQHSPLFSMRTGWIASPVNIEMARSQK